MNKSDTSKIAFQRNIASKLFLIFLSCLIGCNTIVKQFKASPAEPSGFIANYQDMKENREHAPFHGLWFKDKAEFDRTRDKFKKIYFKPITTEFVSNKGWWDKLNSPDCDEYRQDLKKISDYAKQAFDKAFELDPHKKLIVTQEPDSETVIYEIAIVELIATKAHINAIGTVAGSLVPGGGLVKTSATGSIAIEVKVIDGETGEIIIQWADREQDQNSIFSLSDFSWYSHARKSIDTWAEQLVELHNLTTKDQVDDSLPFTLDPL